MATHVCNQILIGISILGNLCVAIALNSFLVHYFPKKRKNSLLGNLWNQNTRITWMIRKVHWMCSKLVNNAKVVQIGVLLFFLLVTLNTHFENIEFSKYWIFNKSFCIPQQRMAVVQLNCSSWYYILCFLTAFSQMINS